MSKVKEVEKCDIVVTPIQKKTIFVAPNNSGRNFSSEECGKAEFRPMPSPFIPRNWQLTQIASQFLTMRAQHS